MKKFRVYRIMTATTVIGEYEAEDDQAALEMADMDRTGNWCPDLCHYCSRDLDLGEIYETEVEEIV